MTDSDAGETAFSPMTVRWSDDSLGAALWQRLWRPASVHIDDATFLVVFNGPDAEKSDLP